jgi:hypothetical protein
MSDNTPGYVEIVSPDEYEVPRTNMRRPSSLPHTLDKAIKQALGEK